MFQEAEQLAAACTAAVPGKEIWQLYHYNAVWFSGQTHGDLGDHAGEAAAAHRLAGLRPTEGKTHRIAAELLAHAITLLAGDERLAAADRQRRQLELEREGMQRLEAAAEHGYDDFERLRDGARLAPLRALPGFAEVLARVKANADAGK